MPEKIRKEIDRMKNTPTKKDIKAALSKRESKLWKVISYALVGIQAVLSIAAIITIVMLDMLPGNYLFAVVIIILMLLLLAFLLMVLSSKQRKKKKKSLKIKRTAGAIISCFTSIVCLVVVLMLSKLISTMSGITNDKIVIETTAVYVLADNSAETIEDAKNYTFGYTQAFDYENTKKAFENIKSEVGMDVVNHEYETVMDMVAGLYSGESGAIILNEAYEDILSDSKEYENFVKETKVIYESKTKVVVEQDDKSDKDITKDPFIVYISGSDTRSSTLSKSRSDVNILGVVNPKTKQVLLLSTPRDYYVDISIAPGSMDKLTHCGIYGIQCSMDTLGNLYNCDVNYYAQVNFNGFETLVDAVGGITVDVDKAFTSTWYSSPTGQTYSFAKGENQLNGAKALVFARERHAFSDGDLSRGRHQMAVIKGLIKKMTSGAILTHYGDILDSLEGMCATDVSSNDMSEFVKMQLSEGGEWNIKSFSVSGGNSKNYTYSNPKQRSYVMTEDPEQVAKAQSLIQKVFNGDTLTDADVE